MSRPRKRPSGCVLTHDRLLEVLSYDPATGELRWRITLSNRAKAGNMAGSVSRIDGYVRLRLDHEMYLAHRLAWFYVHGVWPEKQLDHRNLLRSDNRIDNLRPATSVQQSGNTKMNRRNKSGYKGVFYRTDCPLRPWLASIGVNGGVRLLGHYVTAEEAHKAYRAAAIELFGEDFAR